MGASLRRPRDVFDGDAPSARAAQMIGAASLEISPHEGLAGAGLREWLAPGTRVFVNHPASVTHHDIVAACRKLRRAGLVPVPHIAVRRLASFTQARDFIERAAAEADVKSVLVTGGDPDYPVGPFAASFDLLATGAIEQHGIAEVIFAGYPEGHPGIDARVLDGALDAKLALMRQRGFAVSLVTQFGFDARAIHRWIARLRARGISSPVRVGLAGPASVATLAQFAFRCGVGASLRPFARGQAAFARILAEAAPDDLIAAVVAGEEEGAPIDALHFFTFGGVGRTAEWMRVRGANRGF